MIFQVRAIFGRFNIFRGFGLMVIFGLTVFGLMAKYFGLTVSNFSAYWFRPSDPDPSGSERRNESPEIFIQSAENS